MSLIRLIYNRRLKLVTFFLCLIIIIYYRTHFISNDHYYEKISVYCCKTKLKRHV